MAEFESAIFIVAQNEGGYINDKYDRGGETKYGISKRAYPDIHIKDLSWQRAKEIYHRDFWQPLNLAQLADQHLANQVFDHAVNAGPGRAARMLQEAYNLIVTHNGLKLDGVIGPQTIAAVNGCRWQADLLAVFQGLRFVHYLHLVRSDITQGRFFRGWVKRTFL